MKLFNFQRTRLVNIPTQKYKINWDKAPSKGQQVVQNFLRPYWNGQIVLAEMRIPGTRKRCDIVNCTKKIIVEYSPISHHGTFNKFFHGNRIKYAKTVCADVEKQEWAEHNGFVWIELVEKDLDNLSVIFFQEKFGVFI